MIRQYNIERREKVRAKISIPIQLSINNPPEDIPSEITARTLNISEGGLCFRTRNLLASNSNISINLKSPTSTLRIRAIIAWNNPVDEKRGFSHGIRFIKMEKGNIIILKEILYQNEEFIEEQVKDILVKIEDKNMRNKISSFFKDSVKNFIEDLIILQGKFRNESISNETAQNKIREACDRVIKKCYNIENSISDKIIIRHIKEKFRMIVGTWAYQSEIVRGAYEKPRGYPGDYLMLETIYDNRPISREMGSCIDRYYLNNPYAVAVRNRKEKIKTILNNFLINNLRKEPIRILNIACGSCRELNELLSKEVSINNRVNLIALDHDGEALEYSRAVLKDLPKNINIKYIKENIINFFKTPERCKNLLGSQDLIYSLGLADYLPDTMLKKLIRFCFEVLKNEGKLVITHKDREKQKLASFFPNWFCDWRFIPRNVNEIVNLVKDSRLENFNIEIEREPSEQIFFVIITKTTKEELKNIFSKLNDFFYKKILKSILFTSRLGRRSMLGYADSGLNIDYIYRNKPTSYRPMGKLIDKILLNLPAAKAARNKKEKIIEILTNEIKRNIFLNRKTRIVDLASGPARYLVELITEQNQKYVEALCLDLDKRTLNFGEKLKGNKPLLYKRANVLRLGPYKRFSSKIDWKPNIVIISGFYEFQKDEVVKKSLKDIYESLKQDGIVFFINQVDNPNKKLLEKLGTRKTGDSWVFFYREPNKLKEWMASIGYKEIEINLDRWGMFAFCIGRK